MTLYDHINLILFTVSLKPDEVFFLLDFLHCSVKDDLSHECEIRGATCLVMHLNTARH